MEVMTAASDVGSVRDATLRTTAAHRARAKPSRPQRRRWTEHWGWRMAAATALCALLIFCLASVLAARRERREQRSLDKRLDKLGGRALGAEESPLNDAYMSTYKSLQEFKHDPLSFTQGLAFYGKDLYESAGLYGKSAVRHVNVGDGSSHKKVYNSPRHFGEGIAVVGDTLLQLTWKENVVNRFELPTLKPLAPITLPCANKMRMTTRCHEGWGLAYDGVKLYLTDSTDKLFFLHPTTLEDVEPPREIYDRRMGRPINGVNELEMVDGELWGNVYPMYQGTASQCVVRINATDASVIGWVDLHGLFDKQRAVVKQAPTNLVLNGLAYHQPSGRLYATGKQWDKMYQLRILRDEDAAHQTPEYVKSVCSLGRDSLAARFG